VLQVRGKRRNKTRFKLLKTQRHPRRLRRRPRCLRVRPTRDKCQAHGFVLSGALSNDDRCPSPQTVPFCKAWSRAITTTRLTISRPSSKHQENPPSLVSRL